MAGKKSVIDRFNSKEPTNKLEKIQSDIKYGESELQNLTLIVDMLIVILGYLEIDSFKTAKTQFYYKILGKIAKSEMAYNKLVEQAWK